MKNWRFQSISLCLDYNESGRRYGHSYSPFAAFCEFGLYKWHYYYYLLLQWKTHNNSYAICRMMLFPITWSDSNLNFNVSILFNVK